MKRVSVLVSLVAIGICAVVYGADGTNATPFAGKVVVVYQDTSLQFGLSLVNAKIEKIAGKDFIVGVGADSHAGTDWTKGLHFSIAIDHVTSIFQFTPEQFDKFCKDTGFPQGKE